ncbi:hypothetical protein D3C76_1006540 [compost metagenome]
MRVDTVTLPNTTLRYSREAITPVLPRPTMVATSCPRKFAPANAAANTPNTIDAWAPSTVPRPTAAKVFQDEVLLGR